MQNFLPHPKTPGCGEVEPPDGDPADTSRRNASVCTILSDDDGSTGLAVALVARMPPLPQGTLFDDEEGQS